MIKNAKPENGETAGLLRTKKAVLSERLQAVGIRVKHMSGGTAIIPLSWYFDITQKKLATLVKDKKTGEKLFNEDELAEFDVVAKPEKTPDPSKSDMKEAITKGIRNTENDISGEGAGAEEPE